MVEYSSLKTQANKNSRIPKSIKVKRNAAIKRNNKLLLISFGIILIGSFFLTKNLYLSINSKDLSFAVEYNFTNGYPEENKLLRVQYMTLISREGDTAIVEASGLSKSSPHKSTVLRGSFKKNSMNSWYLEKQLTTNN